MGNFRYTTAAVIVLAIALGALVLAGVLAVYTFRDAYGRPRVSIDASRASVVQQIREMQRLETASFTIEKIIEAGTAGNALQEILYGDRILLVAHGQVGAGFDLSSVSDRDIRASRDSLTLKLPKPEIFSVTLDNHQTRVYDRKLGLLSRGDRDLESEARAVAQDSIRSAACESGILDVASESGRRQLTALFRAAGFKQVTIDIPAADCD